VAVWFVTVKPGGSFTLPPAVGGAGINRTLYFFEGAAAAVGSSGDVIRRHSAIELDASLSAEIATPADAGRASLFLVLQGKPIGEPVVQHGPFVMTTRAEIMRAFSDYQETRFGGWPWPEDSVVFPRDKGRFALVDGKEERPPSDGAARDEL
jgi:redox-sensitive bicupin YhaK (pirin superfamily)